MLASQTGLKVSDFALMLELNKRTEQVAHLKEVSYNFRLELLSCLIRWFSSPPTECSKAVCLTDLPTGSFIIAPIYICSEMSAGLQCYTINNSIEHEF